MKILSRILADKQLEVAARKASMPIKTLEARPTFNRSGFSLRERLQKQPGLIAEFKRRSPSKGAINEGADVQAVARAYTQAGAAAMSVLTDFNYFGGSLQDLELARQATELPLLRKEFIVDEYQIIEAKASGADLILLIAAALTPKQVQTFTRLAHHLGLEVLLELHDETELSHVHADIDLIGVNNRNLNTFETSLNVSLKLARLLPEKAIKVSESGLHHPEDLGALLDAGYRGFLIGEAFMKSADPGAACQAFVSACHPSPVKIPAL